MYPPPRFSAAAWQLAGRGPDAAGRFPRGSTSAIRRTGRHRATLKASKRSKTIVRIHSPSCGAWTSPRFSCSLTTPAQRCRLRPMARSIRSSSTSACTTRSTCRRWARRRRRTPARGGRIRSRAGGRKNMLIHVKLGVPEGFDVDFDAIRATFPYGRLLPVEVYWFSS